MTKVLVTGGLGFIGSQTVDMLVAKGHDVIVLDNPEPQVCTGELPRHKNSHAKYMLGNHLDSLREGITYRAKVRLNDIEHR